MYQHSEQASVERGITRSAPSEAVTSLRRVPLLSRLNHGSLEILARRAIIKRWHAGSVIVAQHEVCGGLYVMTRGRAKLVIFGENGREITLSVLKSGDCFGETCLVDGKPWGASVLAVEDVDVLVIERDLTLRMLQQEPLAALGLLSCLAARLRGVEELVGNLALRDVTSRLRHALLTLAEKQGELCEDGILIRRRPTQQDLANMVGTCRETISRTLSSLARKGLVESRGRSILLRNGFSDGLRPVC